MAGAVGAASAMALAQADKPTLPSTGAQGAQMGTKGAIGGTATKMVTPEVAAWSANGPVGLIKAPQGVPPVNLRGGGPPNDLCADATPVGEGTFAFSNVGAGTDGPSNCGGMGSDVWFMYTPSADGTAVFSTCGLSGLDTVLNAYDACGGSSLVCLDDFCGLQTRITVAVSANVPVILQLGGFVGQQGSGQINISLEGPCEIDCPVGSYTEMEPCGDDNNGGCNNPGFLVETVECGDTICGTAWASGGTRDTDWFEFDSGFAATTVTVTGTAAFPLRLFVLDNNCPPAIVSTGNTFGCNETVTIEGLTGGVGRFFVGTDTFDGFPCGGNNDYVVSFTCAEAETAANDACEDAIDIVGTGLFDFDNTIATTDGLPHGACLAFGTDQITNDVWFCWTAGCDDGDITRIETCGLTGLDTKIAVYQGCKLCPPTDFELLACNDDTCGLESRVQFESVAGQTYLIRIGNFPGASGGSGQFSIECVQPCIVDCPKGAIQEGEDCGSDTNGGCNSNPVITTPIACGDTVCGTAWAEAGTRDTDWYEFTLDDAFLVTWRATGQFPIRVFMLNALCPPAILATNVAGAECEETSVTVLLNAGTYRTFAGTDVFDGIPCGTFNEYVATLDCEPAMLPDNDVCSGAQPIEIGEVVSGDTTLATIDAVPVCGIPTSAPGLWYQVTGNGNTLSATTCVSFFDYDTALSVYCGDCEGVLFCAAGNDDAGANCPINGLLSRATWCSSVGTEYYILVHGFGGQSGSFELVVEDGAPCNDPANCEPCDLTPPKGSIDEGEFCGDDTNGGCNNPGDLTTAAACGDTFFGNAWADGGTRDTDWYQFDVGGAGAQVTVFGEGEFALRLFLLSAVCPPTIIATNVSSGPCNPVSVSAFLTPGTYRFFAGTDVFAGIPCDTNQNDYIVTLDCGALGACCNGLVCSQTTQLLCEMGGGQFQGDGTECPVGSYAVSDCGDAFVDITGNPNAVQGPSCDDCQTTVNVGFNFNYFGNSFATINVGSNGHASFTDFATSFVNQPIPTAAAPNNLIAPLWDDFRTDTGGTLHTLSTATQFTAQWTNVLPFGGGGPSTFQFHLFPDGRIQFRYGNVLSPPSPSVGIENSDGTIGVTAVHAVNTCQEFEFEPAGKNPCEDVPPCCDWNDDGTINSDDYFAFLTDFFAGNADFNGDGATNSDDYFAFLACFFNPPMGCP